MAPPNPFWVSRYLRDHNIDALLGDAVNQAVEQRSTDPAASLAQYFTMLSKRNGEITSITARRTLNSDLKPAVELKVECFYNGGVRTGCITVGEPVTVQAPPVAADGDEDEPAPEEEEEQTPEGKHERLVMSTIKHLNEVVGPALTGVHAASTRECDDLLINLPSAPTILTSLALAEAGAYMKDEPLYLFVAKAVDELLKQGRIALGGGHLVETPSEDQLVNDDERPAPAETEAEPAGNEDGEEGEKPFVPKGIGMTLPCVMLPAVSCGAHAGSTCKVRIKRFWLMTKRDEALKDSVPKIVAAYRQLKHSMEERAANAPAPEGEGEDGGAAEQGPPSLHDDEGFFLAPHAENVQEVLGYIEAAVSEAGLTYGEDIFVCCNLGADDYFVPNQLEVGTYCYKPEGDADGEGVEADNWADWVTKFLDDNPAIAAIEDVAASMPQADYETWRKVRLAVEARGGDEEDPGVAVLGSALYGHDADLFRAGVAEGWAAGAVVRADRLGTLTSLIDNATLFTAIPPPNRALRVVLDHRQGSRAGEAEADVAVGMGAWAIKCGAPSHSTVAKLNRLIWIEEDLQRMQTEAEQGHVDGQLAHLRAWREVYGKEKDEMDRFAQASQAAADGP